MRNTSEMKLEPAKGRLLLARPYLPDPNFFRTVVLLASYGKEGALGFILNRKLEYKLDELLEDSSMLDFPVYLGGPVGTDSLHYLHTMPELAGPEDELLPGIYQGTNFDDLREKVLLGAASNDNTRFFVGYSGWSKGQLEEEIKNKSWFVANPPKGFKLSHDAGQLWQKVLQSMGGKYRVISHYPVDPVLN